MTSTPSRQPSSLVKLFAYAESASLIFLSIAAAAVVLTALPSARRYFQDVALEQRA